MYYVSYRLIADHVQQSLVNQMLHIIRSARSLPPYDRAYTDFPSNYSIAVPSMYGYKHRFLHPPSVVEVMNRDPLITRHRVVGGIFQYCFSPSISFVVALHHTKLVNADRTMVVDSVDRIMFNNQYSLSVLIRCLITDLTLQPTVANIEKGIANSLCW